MKGKIHVIAGAFGPSWHNIPTEHAPARRPGRLH
jgi:hypothetical protein